MAGRGERRGGEGGSVELLDSCKSTNPSGCYEFVTHLKFFRRKFILLSNRVGGGWESGAMAGRAISRHI